MTKRCRQSGLSLIEVIVAIVVIGIAASVVLGVLSANAGASADPMVRAQAVAVANAYLEEILLRDFDDPDASDGETARVDFDDVDDYDGLSDSGARNQFDVPVAGLADYDVSVTVTPSTALPGIPAADALRVDVTVTRAPDIALTLSAYRTRR